METHDDLLQAARAETGLEDFGEDSFREGLELLVRSLREEARLHAFGEAVLRHRILQHLGQRLQVEAWYRRQPEIDDVPIVAPLIGLGLPRTGSTALTFLLAQDDRARFLRRWESGRPCPPPSTVAPPDPRIRQAAEEGGIGTREHVPAEIAGPMECQELMALDFKSQIFLAFAQLPSYAEWLLDADLTSTYAYERRVLKLLQWGEPERPWQLKCPTHLLYLEHLDAAFPDARFVMTHRDPAEVILSVAAVYADLAGTFSDDVDLGYLGELNVEQWSVGMRRGLAFRDAGNDHRFYDIHFRAMQRDPVGQVRGLYDWLGIPVTDGFASAMATWWKDNAEQREPGEHADPAAFGIDLDRVRPLFADYSARIPAWTSEGT